MDLSLSSTGASEKSNFFKRLQSNIYDCNDFHMYLTYSSQKFHDERLIFGSAVAYALSEQ